MTFDPAFRLFRVDPQDRLASWPTSGVTHEAIFRELDDELTRRRQSYPALLARGKMTRAEMDHELRVWSRLRDGNQPDPRPLPPTGAAASWVEIIHALRREIALRRQRYPRLVATGRLDEATATRRLELIEWLHAMEWDPHVWAHSEAARAQLAEPRPAAGYPEPLRSAA